MYRNLRNRRKELKVKRIMNPRMSAKEAYHWIGMIEHLQSKCKEFEDRIEELEEEIVDIDSENEDLENEVDSLQKENSDLRKVIHHLVEGDK